MNKKGDITVTIFVIGVIALCFFALISFYISSSDTSDNFENVQLIEKVSSKIEKGDKMVDGGERYKEIATSRTYWVGSEKVLFEVTYRLD